MDFIVIIYACTQCFQPYFLPPLLCLVLLLLLAVFLLHHSLLLSFFFYYIHNDLYSLVSNMLRTEYCVPILENIITVTIMIIVSCVDWMDILSKLYTGFYR